jgi:hypothetical protein
LPNRTTIPPDPDSETLYSPDAQVALETFLKYSPTRLRVLLLSRTELTGPLQRRMLDGRIRLVEDNELRLTADESAQLGELLGATPEHCQRGSMSCSRNRSLGLRPSFSQVSPWRLSP